MRLQAFVVPAVLFFDESYRDHEIYRWMDCMGWVFSADTLVLVGTSNSVGVTQRLLQYANVRGMHVFDINTDPADTQPVANVSRIIGPSEVSLPLLREAISMRCRS